MLVLIQSLSTTKNTGLLDEWWTKQKLRENQFNHVNGSPIPRKKLEMICLLPGETVFQGLMLHMFHSYVSTSRIVSLWNWQIEKDSVFQVSTKCYSVVRPVIFWNIITIYYGSFTSFHPFLIFSPGLLQVNQQAELL